MILLYTLKQNVSILRRLVSEISHFEFDAYRVILPETSDLKLFWAVYIIQISLDYFTCYSWKCRQRWPPHPYRAPSGWRQIIRQNIGPHRLRHRATTVRISYDVHRMPKFPSVEPKARFEKYNKRGFLIIEPTGASQYCPSIELVFRSLIWNEWSINLPNQFKILRSDC